MKNEENSESEPLTKCELNTFAVSDAPEETEEGKLAHMLETDPTQPAVSLCISDKDQPLQNIFENKEEINETLGESPSNVENKTVNILPKECDEQCDIATDFTPNAKPCSVNKDTQTTEEYDPFEKNDYSVLQPPLNLGVKNVKQILTCVQSGSLEVQDIIFNECNVIYECKVCHNLFRCLANLLSHKRFYCKDTYAKVYDVYKKQAQSQVTVVIEPESPPELVEEEANDVPVTLEFEGEVSTAQALPEIQNFATKIFTPVSEGHSFTREPPVESQDETFIHLEHIKGNPNAVYQTVFETSDGLVDSVTLHNEKKNIIGDSSAITPNSALLLSREQKLMKRSDCDISNLTCLKCTLSFDTLKGLYLHMMTNHANKRVCYPCIYCKTSFLQMYGVTRHIMKVHKKTKEQVSRIRDIVKRRAFICKAPFSSDQFEENKEPKTEMVLAPKLHPCGKCNRLFDRKSSQISHEKFCRFGGAEPTPVSAKKKIVKTSVTIVHRCVKCGRAFKHKSSQISHTKFCKGSVLHKTSPKVKPKISTPATKNVVLSKTSPLSSKQVVPEDSTRPKRDVKKKKMSKDFVSSQSLKWRSANKVEAVSGSKTDTTPPKLLVEPKGIKSMTPTKKPPLVIIKKPLLPANQAETPAPAQVSSPPPRISPQTRVSPQSKLPNLTKSSASPNKSSQTKQTSPLKPSPGEEMKSPQSSKDVSVNVIEGRVYSIINAQKLSCLKCNRKFSTFSNLRRHAATHIGWMRFKCKHCNYQCFNRSDCRSHIQRMHSYTTNVDKNIIKLATGKLNVRREDLLTEGTGKLSTKGFSPSDSKQGASPKELVNIKPKAVSSVVLKPVPFTVAPYQPTQHAASHATSAAKSTARKSKGSVEIKIPKTVISVVQRAVPTEPHHDVITMPVKSSARKSKDAVEIKTPKPVISIVQRTVPRDTQHDIITLPVKSSARKSKDAVEMKTPKSVISIVQRTVPTEPQHNVITLPVKSSARKSTGGASKRLLKRILIPPPPTSSPPPKLKPVSPSSSSPHVITPPSLNIISPPPQLSSKKKTVSPPNLGSPSGPTTPSKATKGDDVGSATTKPHVILLNSSCSRSLKADATPTLVTRGGTYTKTVLTLKMPIKTNVKQRNGQASENSESNVNSGSQLLDHQYT